MWWPVQSCQPARYIGTMIDLNDTEDRKELARTVIGAAVMAIALINITVVFLAG